MPSDQTKGDRKIAVFEFPNDVHYGAPSDEPGRPPGYGSAKWPGMGNTGYKHFIELR